LDVKIDGGNDKNNRKRLCGKTENKDGGSRKRGARQRPMIRTQTNGVLPIPDSLGYGRQQRPHQTGRRERQDSSDRLPADDETYQLAGGKR